MPASAFFQRLGLFVLPDFLDPKYTMELCSHLAAAPMERASVVGSNGEQRLNLESRKVDACVLPKETTAPLRQRLLEIQPALEKHFGTPLARCEPPQYLIYNPGDFFKAHQDIGGYDVKHAIRERRVSVVIFLNRESQEPAEGAYGEGHLTFYGLMEGPQWGKCAFPLDAEPGLLIAFPSDKWHEVKPVSHGRRLTVVTWFHPPGAPAEADRGI
jgi:SM-20-related protein